MELKKTFAAGTFEKERTEISGNQGFENSGVRKSNSTVQEASSRVILC